MKIDLLNLPVDNNYGGMLQRYALVEVLKKMGHEVTHLNLRFNYNQGTLCYRIMRDAKRLAGRIFRSYNGPIMPEYHRQKRYELKCHHIDIFYKKRIKHTKAIKSKKSLYRNTKGDAIIVGSDQVWRKTIAAPYGIDTYFLDYLSDNNNIDKIAYGVSFGVSENELQSNDIIRLSPLFKKFKAVSVRELSGSVLLNQYGWEEPIAEIVLDPTLLLDKEDYCSICKKEQLSSSGSGEMLCYILDINVNIQEAVFNLANKKGLKPVFLSLDSKVTIEEWLQSFYNAEYVVTDSYHGLVFSIIMRKNFKLLGNSFRGNARFESLLNLLEIYDPDNINWDNVTKNINDLRLRSLYFLDKALHRYE